MSGLKPSYWSSQHLFQSISVDAKAAAIEFVGTTFFFLLGLGGIQAATGEALQGGSGIEQVLYIATSMGFSLLVTAWLFYRVTGGLFNPNITLALFLVGVVGPIRFVLFCIAQMVGAIAAPAIVYGLTPGPLSVKYDFRAGLEASEADCFVPQHIPTAGDKFSSGRVHRDVHHGCVGHRRTHVGRRETFCHAICPGDIFSSIFLTRQELTVDGIGWHRADAVRRTPVRQLLLA